MNKIITLCFCLVAGFAGAQTAPRIGSPGQPTQTEENKLKWVQNQVQAEFNRLTAPVYVDNSLLFLSTNSTDGIIVVRTNATVLVHIGLPNPTNNLGRKYEVTTAGASTAVLTNWYVTGTFSSNNAMSAQSGYFIGSNKTALAYSTGTNWYVRDF